MSTLRTVSFNLACSRLRGSGEKSVSKKKCKNVQGYLSQVARVFARFNSSSLYYLRAWHWLPLIFLDKSGRGRNLCPHPQQFILSLLQIQIFLRCQSNHYHSIHWVCQIKAAVRNLSDSSKSQNDQQIKGIWRRQQSRFLFPNLSRKDPASRVIHDLLRLKSLYVFNEISCFAALPCQWYQVGHSRKKFVCPPSPYIGILLLLTNLFNAGWILK